MTTTKLRLDDQICFAVYATAHAFNRTYKPLLEPLGLTYPQYLVMMVLWEQNRMMIKDIGARLDLDTGTLSPLLKRLEKSDLVQRRRDGADERQVYIQITEKGRALEAAAANVMPGILDASGCSLEQLVTLRDGLKALGKNLRKDRDRDGDYL
jgi:MarR family transcriptional regulator, organic hydroperoxide resistance regulator